VPLARLSRQFVDAHHIIEWDDDGLTDLVNLLLFCRFHHRKVHQGHYTVDVETADVEIRRPDRTLVTARDVDPEDAHHPSTSPTAPSSGEAGTLELHDIIQNMAHRDDREDRAA
jgi:hypothetical protein